MRDDDFSGSSTDIEVVSLNDRRKIAALNAQVADLERKLADALDRATPGLSKKMGGECYHHGTFEVADHTMSVTCKLCGAEMDPFTVLRKIAHREVNFCYQLNSLREESSRLAAEIPKLKARRSTLKRDVRRRQDVEVVKLCEIMRAHDAKAFVVQWWGGAWHAAFRTSYGMVNVADPKQKVAAAGTMEEAVAIAIEALVLRKASP